jgi:hypothetical protein
MAGVTDSAGPGDAAAVAVGVACVVTVADVVVGDVVTAAL